MKKNIRIATRKSELALWQASHVAELLRSQNEDLEVELLPMVTRGDVVLDQPLAEIGGKGLFLKELERALLRKEADIAVHSMKDVPIEAVAGLAIDVVLTRGNPCDALLSHTGLELAELPAGSRVGTSSLRRQCQLKHCRPDLVVADLRGNVNTRLRKLENHEYDAIILACAGLERLGLEHRITQVLRPPAWLPAATQGTIGVQCRVDDEDTAVLIGSLMDRETALITRAERHVSRRLEGSCQVPLAVFAELDKGLLSISGLVGTADGRKLLRSQASGPPEEIEALSGRVATELLEQGADRIIAALSSRRNLQTGPD